MFFYYICTPKKGKELIFGKAFSLKLNKTIVIKTIC